MATRTSLRRTRAAVVLAAFSATVLLPAAASAAPNAPGLAKKAPIVQPVEGGGGGATIQGITWV